HRRIGARLQPGRLGSLEIRQRHVADAVVDHDGAVRAEHAIDGRRVDVDDLQGLSPGSGGAQRKRNHGARNGLADAHLTLLGSAQKPEIAPSDASTQGCRRLYPRVGAVIPRRSIERMARMHSELGELLHSWHDFYLLVGTASATLVGLMFVAASIGAQVFS